MRQRYFKSLSGEDTEVAKARSWLGLMECGMGNAELKKVKYLIFKSCSPTLSLFSAFRIPPSAFLSSYTST
jgi:hypothetical protein